jgi:hypothetical protein
MVYRHSVAPQYAMAALTIVVGVLVTWRFLIGGLWVGLSGSKRLFVGSALACCLALILAVIGLAIFGHYVETHRDRPPDPNRFLAVLQWVAALAVIAKLWMAARHWRHIAPARVRRYLLIWSGGVFCLIALALLLWADGMLSALLEVCPVDPLRLKYFLLLFALLVVPFVRLGIAPLFLAKNRHASRLQITNQ